jgi:cytochrome c oxidase subunit 4
MASNHSSEHHITPFSVYMKVFSALLVLTVLTVAVSSHVTGFHLGPLNAAIAMAIATLKAVLVMAFFMHLKYEGVLNRVIFGSAFFFLIVLYFFSVVDIFTRNLEKSPL